MKHISKRNLLITVFVVVILALPFLVFLLQSSSLFPLLTGRIPSTLEAPFSSMPVNAERLEVSGTIVAIDVEGRSLTIEVAPSSERKEVHIWPETRIVRFINHSTTGDALYATQEINISDLAVGAEVRVRHGGGQGDELTFVDEIFAGEESFENLASSSPMQFSGHGTILAFDQETNTLQYEVSSLVDSESSINSLHVTEDIDVYAVSDQSRVNIVHARTPAVIQDVQQGDKVFIAFKPRLTDEEPPVAQTLIISK